MSGHRIVSADIGGTNIKACLFIAGAPTATREIPTQAKDGAARVLERTAQLLAAFAPFDAVGISTAGQVDPVAGVIRYANENLPGYTGMDVKAFFQTRFNVPVAVENDVNAAALGEGSHGSAKGYPDYLCLTYGTGVGGAIVLGGALYHGAVGSAGEFGALAVHPEDAIPGSPYSGCYEKYASATALVAAAQAADPTLTDGRTLFSHIHEPAVQAIVDRWIAEIAIGLCSLLHIFNPACIVLGGGVMEQPYVLDGILSAMERRAIPSFLPCHIVSASLGNMAGLYGAADLAAALLK